MLEPVAPGLAFEVVPPPAPPAPLRSDVAGFLGATRRGAVGEVVRVAEWRDYRRLFGGLEGGAATPYAVRSYFENGGEIAWVVRLAGPAAATAAGDWPGAGDPPLPGHRTEGAGGRVVSEAFTAGGDAVSRFTVTASSPGAWGEGGRVEVTYRRQGLSGGAEADLEIRFPGEPAERLHGLPAASARELADAVNAASRRIVLTPDLAAPSLVSPAPAALGPARLAWSVTLSGGTDDPPRREEYLAAVAAAGQEREIAFTALPDLYAHLAPADAGGALTAAVREVLRGALAEAERRHDRLLLVDLPAAGGYPQTAAAAAELRALFDAAEARSAAVYHPWLWVADPLGEPAAPQRRIPPSGPVAGLISRLDRERGAHHTPANAPLRDALDADGAFTPPEQGRLNAAGVNLVRCFPNRGLVVWGGRTLSPEPAGRFVAHRRLVHRLVRAIRRVAEPLVFETNDAQLRLALARGITSVLLAAYRAGALAGGRPEEAFRVRCDEETNPPEEVELGRVLCEIELAPAAPMERITLRVALGREGELEVFES